MPLCPYCHTVVGEDNRFCPECGRPLAVGGAVVGEAAKGKSKKKLAGIIIACTIAIIVTIVLVSVKPWVPTYTLSVGVNPTQAGFTSSSGGKYKSSAQVTLTASPASGYIFDHWSGGVSGTTSTITITMDSDKNVIANFKATHTLTINISPLGTGSVSPSSGEYESGVQVTLTASPASGYTFDYWSGSASGTTSTVTITMDSDKSLTAHFTKVLFSDDFSDESSGWDTSAYYGGQVAYLNGHLDITDYEAYTGAMYSESQHYFTDFILEVQTWLVGGTDNNWQEVSCRQRDRDNHYTFAISADGYYDVLKWVNGIGTYLVSITYSPYIHQGQGVTNLIQIECIGSSLSLSVNGHLLATVTDASFTGGNIVLLASALDDTFTEVAFDNIIVSEP
jgi:uncharacterized repeat protein (TIGR02543 family)